MRIFLAAAALAAAALALFATPSIAQEPAVAIHTGQKVVDAGGRRVGVIDRVNPDDSISIIYDMKFITIPAASLTVADGVVKTSLTRKDIIRL